VDWINRKWKYADVIVVFVELLVAVSTAGLLPATHADGTVYLARFILNDSSKLTAVNVTKQKVKITGLSLQTDPVA